MAKPPGRSARTATFTVEAAKRIAAAVHKVEQGSRDQPAAGRRTSSGGDELVRATFTGTWTKGDAKTCTDAVLPAVEYTAQNYFATVGTADVQKTCVLAYASGEWVLIACEC